MPTRPKPAWGHRPPGFRDEPLFDAHQLGQIAAALGISTDEKRAQLDDALHEVAQPLRWVIYLETTYVPEPAVKACLHELHRLALELRSKLDEADLTTRAAIRSAYPDNPMAHEADLIQEQQRLSHHIGEPIRANGDDLFRRDLEHLDRLRHVILAAESFAPSGDGRPGLKLAKFIAVKLAPVFSEITGMAFSVTKRKRRTPEAAALDLALRALIPDLTEANVRVVLRHARAVARAKHKPRPNPD